MTIRNKEDVLESLDMRLKRIYRLRADSFVMRPELLPDIITIRNNLEQLNEAFSSKDLIFRVIP